MTLTADKAICKRSIKDRSELQQKIAEYQAKGGRIEQVDSRVVRYVPLPFKIKPERR
jgi:hypothetical protein